MYFNVGIFANMVGEQQCKIQRSTNFFEWQLCFDMCIVLETESLPLYMNGIEFLPIPTWEYAPLSSMEFISEQT